MARSTVSNKKTRDGITIDKVLKLKAQCIANIENRSFNNLLIVALEEYLQKYKDILEEKENEFNYQIYDDKYNK
jgi:hypothetical protein